MAVKATVARPVVASVVTEEALKIELPVVARERTAPFTREFDESSARTVKVRDDEPSALRVWVGEEISKLAIEAAAGSAPCVAGVFASPPPPPQADKTTAISVPTIVFNIDIVNVLFMPR